VDRLVLAGLLEKGRHATDRRRVGLLLTAAGQQILARLPGPAEGLLPQALSEIPEVVLKTLNINLAELIRALPGSDERFRQVPLAEMIRSGEAD
jgi:DNA-binding MarR family transcriptional regulator